MRIITLVRLFLLLFCFSKVDLQPNRMIFNFLKHYVSLCTMSHRRHVRAYPVYDVSVCTTSSHRCVLCHLSGPRGIHAFSGNSLMRWWMLALACASTSISGSLAPTCYNYGPGFIFILFNHLFVSALWTWWFILSSLVDIHRYISFTIFFPATDFPEMGFPFSCTQAQL